MAGEGEGSTGGVQEEERSGGEDHQRARGEGGVYSLIQYL